MALMSLTGYAQETGDVVCVCKTNGEVLSFFREEIKEMSYSYEDTLGVTHDEIASQLITLEDSVYTIPLDQIDSISFVIPPTVLKPGVNDLAPSLSQYVVDSKELTLYLSGSTPESLLPAVDTRVVLAERSFAGDVASVTQEDGNYVVRATQVDLEEIFETYYAVSVIDFEEDGTATTRPKSGKRAKDKIIKLPPIGFDVPEDLINWFLPLEEDMSVKAKFSAKVQPTFTIKSSSFVNKGKRANVSIIGDFNFSEEIGFGGKIDYSKDLITTPDVIDVPLGETFLFLYNRWGIVFKAAAEMAVDLQWKQHYRVTFNWSHNSKEKGLQKPKASFERVSEDFTPEGSIKGSAMIGPFTEIGIKFVTTELAKAALRVDAGFELVGDYVFVNKDIMEASNSTKFYEFLKAKKVDLNFVVGGSIQLSFLEAKQNFDLPWNYNKNLASFKLVPTFSDVTFDRDGNNGAASAKILGTCILPMKTGFIVSDKDENNLDTWTTEKSYRKGGSEMSHTFNSLEQEKEYVLNPKVVIFGYDVKATPKAGMKAEAFPVHIIDIKQTGSDYSEQKGYVFEGVGYYYKFNVTTTVELDPTAENIKDWGYIYHDIYDVDKKISCAVEGGSNPYADKRWAYYFDQPQRTVVLTAYVQYEGETDIRKGGTHTFPVRYGGCPDNNHPHMIDMGLPSGTKWSCCNMGASAPEQAGGFYMFGETQPKTSFGELLYQYWNDADGDGRFDWSYDKEGVIYSDEITDIGGNISGTRYDAATANWGAPWQMPTLEQAYELDDNTSFEWVTRNGVHCQKLTGMNGGIIFLPVTGYHFNNKFLYPDELGYFWTAKADDDNSCNAYCFGIDNEEGLWYSLPYRWDGITIRPVAP